MDMVSILKHFVEISFQYFPQIFVGLAIAAITGVGGYFALLIRNRPRLALTVTWHHVPASANFAIANEWEISNPEFYRADFKLTNSGESAVYLDTIDISAGDSKGRQIALSELRINDNREGLTKKAIGFPEQLKPHQIFTFSHSFSRETFLEMDKTQHYLTVGSARPIKLKVHIKL